MRGMMMGYRWRRTRLTAADGRQVEDDWCLELPNGDAVARIYRVRGGPRDGHWFWAVQIDERFRPSDGGSAYCETGREAKKVVEARVRRSCLDSRIGRNERRLFFAHE